jgi:hypothetical protein
LPLACGAPNGKDKIALAVGAEINNYKMAKHFTITRTDDGVAFARKIAHINAEAALDGVLVLRTSLSPRPLNVPAAVKAYQQLAQGRARLPEPQNRRHRGVADPSPQGRPRARHVFLCMLACYLEWHMPKHSSRSFDDHDKAEADADRISIVAKAHARQQPGASP